MANFGSWVSKETLEIFDACPVVKVDKVADPGVDPGLHVFYGRACAGKTTVAKALCNTHPHLVYGGDLLSMRVPQVDALLQAAAGKKILVEMQSMARDRDSAAMEVRRLLDRGTVRADVAITVEEIVGLDHVP